MSSLPVRPIVCCSLPRDYSCPLPNDWSHVPESLPFSSERGFREIWTLADSIPGWLTTTQAELLHEQARSLPDNATAVEMGSHQGRSTVVLAHALQERNGRLIAID